VTHSPSARVAASTNVLFLFLILGYSHCIASGIQCVCGPATLSDVRKLPPSAKRNGGGNRVQTTAGVAMGCGTAVLWVGCVIGWQHHHLFVSDAEFSLWVGVRER